MGGFHEFYNFFFSFVVFCRGHKDVVGENASAVSRGTGNWGVMAKRKGWIKLAQDLKGGAGLEKQLRSCTAWRRRCCCRRTLGAGLERRDGSRCSAESWGNLPLVGSRTSRRRPRLSRALKMGVLGSVSVCVADNLFGTGQDSMCLCHSLCLEREQMSLTRRQSEHKETVLCFTMSVWIEL